MGYVKEPVFYLADHALCEEAPVHHQRVCIPDTKYNHTKCEH